MIKSGGRVNRFDEADNVTPAEQAKQNKIKKDSCAKQGRVWAPGDGVSKEWGCYDPEVLKNTIKLEADPSCDEAFIKKLIAQDGCFINGNASDCIYMASLSSMGLLGVKSGYDALFQVSNAKNSSFLKSYQKIYERVIENKIKHNKLISLSDKAEALASQNLYRSLFEKEPPLKKMGESDYDYANRLERERYNYLNDLDRKNIRLSKRKYYDVGSYEHTANLKEARRDAMLQLTEKDPDLNKIVKKINFEGETDIFSLRYELNKNLNALIKEDLAPHSVRV